MYLKNKYLALLFLAILSSCANIVAPQGGKKDTTPPFAVSSIPGDSALNFSAHKIIITFSERIQLLDAEKNISISPSIGNGLSFEIKKNKLTIKLKNLRPNTTYTINARNAIADLTEANALPNLKYIFSTGNAIDSNKITGVVINASNLDPSKNTMVGLYKNFTDSMIIRRDPDYFSYTNDRGVFTLENIKAGFYSIVSINDKNNNKHWEAGEEIGYLQDSILVDTTDKKIILRQFQQTVSTNYLISAISNSLGIYAFQFDSVSSRDVSINQEDPSMDKRQPYYPVFFPGPCGALSTQGFVISKLNPKDSAHFNYAVNKHIYKTAIKVSTKKPALETRCFENIVLNTGFETIAFVQNLDTSLTKRNKISLLKDTSVITGYTVSFDPSYIRLSHLEKGVYRLIFSKGALSDQFGVENDSLVFIFTVLETEDLQTLILNTDSSFKANSEIRIIRDDGCTYCRKEPVVVNKKYSFSLIPGKYKILIVENPSSNKPEGNFFRHTQPEKIVYYKEIDLRTGFDIEENLHILSN